MSIRNSAKAIIIQNNKILLTKNKDDDGIFYLFPGGGQEKGETLHEALIRECIEETGEVVAVGELVHIREYIGKNHEHAAFDFNLHQVEFYFKCTFLHEWSDHHAPSNPDSHQVGVEWIDLDALKNYRLYPKEIASYIVGRRSKVYLGDIN
ncbi:MULTISPECIES: NUDIX domain-containing protein [Bacillaceae]|uniref:NUDIX domain-containing protein n=1 Tax=Bacillaceae TaxID=186817 RepID=UPI001C59DE54|nr:NUDIX domain-containing protein [Rossellomorea sp. YZS02]MBW3114644.1 NUDIX domain-containing protein [Bacillus sp. MCCB 382]MDX8345690.1 NUDIX domain-containing protein [Rossellomorea sp. YZS02]